ncbi:DUF2505 domain-containing protein [Actinobacteria bacterium YIM 96077]|uniref:DUF2505 domain-containing protein n=1 Tax=Phytoactinopolyspora halophila TaxID=1981511 RepID=A0A329R286_9ACTN|nr:DUF2505 domain-containing protein [Phytoactinopolyspora halophila]AYY12079.1 DUF2505 domain-containing protein [Actinobacteria bacterium YIM 96077]RAW18687.1 hypothetical protein DPM12_01025 [Phytoactinopolyspora halophila]
MDLHSELRFEADPYAVFSMLTDEEYIAKKTAAAKALRHDVTVTHDFDDAGQPTGQVTIKLVRVMPPDVPNFARRFVGETIDVKQTDTWRPAAPDGSRDGEIHLEMIGMPVTCHGRMSLRAAGPSTVLTIRATIEASVPLFGNKIEEAVHQGLTEAARIEEQVGRDWLAGPR